MSICFALTSKICKASAFATFGSSVPTKSRRKYVYVGALVQVSCLDLLPSGSCQKRKALFADGPPMVPVKKKSNRPHLFKKTFGDNSALGKIA